MRNLLLACAFTALYFVPTLVSAQCGCTFTVGANQYDVDGAVMGVKPGDVICIPSGNIGSKNFKNIVGTAAKPVIIKNCGGKSYLEKSTASSFGFNFSKSKFFHLTGTGDPAIFYGFEINGTNQAVQIGDGSSDFEVDHFRISNTGYAGLALKTNPTCNPETWRQNYTMYNVKAHDNYFTNTLGESIYIGNSHYHSSVKLTCGGVATTILEHAIQNCEVYNNIVENSGRDGIQVAAVTVGGKVYNNLIDGFGLKDPEHIHGLAINPGFTGVVYNNTVRNGVGFGIQSLGDGVSYYNNVVENAQRGGITVDDRNATPGRSYIITNNTFIKNARYGAYFLSLAGVNNKFYNNIVISDGTPTFKNTAKLAASVLDVQNNYFTSDINAAKFEDPAARRYALKAGSPAIDAGRDVSSLGILLDIEQRTRPVNTAYDIGAYEYQGNVLTANAGNDVSITMPTNTVTLTGTGTSPLGAITSYTWTKKSGGVATLSGASTANLQLTNLAVGIYEFTLTVSDGSKTASDNVVVTVLPLILNQLPTVSAGVDKIITLPTSSVTLTATATDSDGTIVKTTWTQLSGPTTAILLNPTTLSLTASGLAVGLYQFQIEVEDNGGAKVTDKILVTVNAGAGNTPPTVAAGVDQTITLPTTTATLTGTAVDPDGSIASVLWTKTSGPAATLSGATTPTLSLSGLVAGTYVFRLTATDNSGATAFDELTVQVNTANLPPTVNAGIDKTITLPTNTATFTGTASDSDGTIASYAWTQVSGPATTLAGSTSASLAITLTGANAGDYIFRLTVTDNKGATATDEVKLTVLSAPNNPPVVAAGTDQAVTLPIASVSFPATALDTDGTLNSLLWTKVSGPTATLSGTTGLTLTVTNLVVGTYVFRLTATDNKGATAFDEVSLTVTSANQPPTVNAGVDKTITLPVMTATFTATAADTDGSIASYAWSQVSGPPASISGATTPTLNLTLSGATAGTYVFRVLVTDNQGATAQDQVSLIVNPAVGNLVPSVSAGADQTVTLPLASVALTGTASDPDGTITGLQWIQSSGPAGSTLSGTSTLTLTVSNLVAGTYTFRLTATDNAAAQAFDEVSLTVEAANQAPGVNAGIDQTLTLPTQTTSFTAIALDPDGTISSYAWAQVAGASTATLSGTTSSVLAVVASLPGTYTFQVVVTDDQGATAVDVVILTVLPEPANLLPLVDAGLDQTLTLPLATVTLNATASDPDGTIASYQWVQTAGPAANLQGLSTASPTLVDPAVGTYTFQLTVTDNRGGQAIDWITILVQAAATVANPTAYAGADTVVYLPLSSIVLSGRGSDSDGVIQSFSWQQVSGPGNTTLVPNGSQVEIVGLQAGTYVFALTVLDDDLLTDTDEVSVRVAIHSDQLGIARYLTPNGDGQNDAWIITHVEMIEGCPVEIFTRDGRKIFYTDSYDNSWDGTHQGKPLVAGDYYFKISCEGKAFAAGGVRIIR